MMGKRGGRTDSKSYRAAGGRRLRALTDRAWATKEIMVPLTKMGKFKKRS